MTENAILLSCCRRADGTFAITDALGREYVAADEVSLGKLVASLTADEDVPRIRVEKRHDIVGMVATAFRRFLPQHREIVDAVEPAAHAVTTRAMAYQQKRRGRVAGRDG